MGFARCWGPLIPTRLRRGWTGYAPTSSPATPDEHRRALSRCILDLRDLGGKPYSAALPVKRVRESTCDRECVTRRLETPDFFVTRPRHLLDTHRRALFFVTCEHSSLDIGGGSLFRNSGEQMETEKCLLVTKKLVHRRTPNYRGSELRTKGPQNTFNM